MKRIIVINKVYHGGEFMYKIELCLNFHFDFSGSQITYVTNVKEVYEVTKHIVFCNGDI